MERKTRLIKKMKANFKVNDFVFAQVKGWMPWPAQVVEVMKNRCEVKFFESIDYPMWVFVNCECENSLIDRSNWFIRCLYLFTVALFRSSVWRTWKTGIILFENTKKNLASAVLGGFWRMHWKKLSISNGWKCQWTAMNFKSFRQHAMFVYHPRGWPKLHCPNHHRSLRTPDMHPVLPNEKSPHPFHQIRCQRLICGNFEVRQSPIAKPIFVYHPRAAPRQSFEPHRMAWTQKPKKKLYHRRKILRFRIPDMHPVLPNEKSPHLDRNWMASSTMQREIFHQIRCQRILCDKLEACRNWTKWNRSVWLTADSRHTGEGRKKKGAAHHHQWTATKEYYCPIDSHDAKCFTFTE